MLKLDPVSIYKEFDPHNAPAYLDFLFQLPVPVLVETLEVIAVVGVDAIEATGELSMLDEACQQM